MPSKSIFITGGSGFVGRAVVSALIRRGWTVRALVRRVPADLPGAELIQGDLFDSAALDRGMAGCDAVVHLVGIIREAPGKGQTFERIHVEGTRQILDAARRAGIGRLVHMSALGARLDSASDYARTKALAEGLVHESGLAATIFRPSVIHGPGGEFTSMVTQWARGRAMPFVFMPYFGTGLLGQEGRLLQPVFIDDVARAFAEAAERDDLAGKTLPLVGDERLTWPAMYKVVLEGLQRRRMRVGIPTWYARLLTRVVPAAWLPFNESQVIMAGEDNVADAASVQASLGWRPRGFSETFRAYAASLEPSSSR